MTNIVDPAAAAAILARGGQVVPQWIAPAAAGAAVLLGLVLIGWQLWQKRGLVKKPPKSGRRGATGSIEVEEFSREATEVVDRLAALLDAKSDRLERLLEEADRRLLALERAAGSTARREEFAEGARRAFRPQAHSKAGEELSVGDTAMQDRIADLAGRGLRPVEIATQLHQPIGQVELVIALRRGAVKL